LRRFIGRQRADAGDGFASQLDDGVAEPVRREQTPFRRAILGETAMKIENQGHV